MKIMAPLNPAYNITRLSAAGADGFYFGYVPDGWVEQYGNGYYLNRRGHRLNANFTSGNIAMAINEIHLNGKLAYVVFNNHQYTYAELQIIFDSLIWLKNSRIDGVITADINIINFCTSNNLPVHLSTCATTYNRYSCDFYAQIGVNRIILPRDMSICEMDSIIKNIPIVEYEAFVYNSPCRFSECVCLSNHGLYGNICKRIKHEPQTIVGLSKGNKYIDYYQSNSLGFCALCQIYAMKQIGIKWLKIVERTLPFKVIEASCQKVKHAILECNNQYNEQMFINHIRMIEECNDYYNCYYK